MLQITHNDAQVRFMNVNQEKQRSVRLQKLTDPYEITMEHNGKETVHVAKHLEYYFKHGDGLIVSKHVQHMYFTNGNDSTV